MLCPHKVKVMQRFHNQAQLCLPSIILTLWAQSSGLQTDAHTLTHYNFTDNKHTNQLISPLFSLCLYLCIYLSHASVNIKE